MKGDLHMARHDGRRRAKQIKTEKEDRDGAFHLALPYDVIRSVGYRRASHTARSLLIDVCNQDPRFRNGKLVVTAKALRPLGWNSEGTMRRALSELIDCGLIVKTRVGSMNSAAWFAVTWRGLDQTDGLDINPDSWGAVHRGSYRSPPTKTTSESRPATHTADAQKNAPSTPSQGAQQRCIAPSQGVVAPTVAPSKRAIRPESGAAAAPSQGDYLERSHLGRTPQGLSRSRRIPTSMAGRLALRTTHGMQRGYAEARTALHRRLTEAMNLSAEVVTI